MRKLPFPLTIICPVHCLSHCPTQLVGLLSVLMKSFLSRQWESLRSEEGHSAENVKAHGIRWVMRPSLAHRKIKSPFLPSNLEFMETSRKQAQEQLFWKYYAFRLPIPLKKTFSISKGQKMNSVVNGIGKKEPPDICRRGLNQNVNWRH